MLKALTVLLIELTGESRRKIPFGVDTLAPSDLVRPQRHIRTRNIAPEYIKAFVPIVELTIVRGFKRDPTQPKRLHVIAFACTYNRVRNVRGIRNLLGQESLRLYAVT